MSIYRTEEGEALVRDWCEQRLAGWPPHDRSELATSLGTTTVTTTSVDPSAGTGPPTVLWLPGTNFNAATSASLARHLGPGGGSTSSTCPVSPV